MKKIISLLFSLVLVTSACAPSMNTGTVMRVSMDEKGEDVNNIPLERYVLGVLSKEVPASWCLEALKAQAVASRTYALYRKENPRSEEFDLVASTSDQAYGAKKQYDAQLKRAVQETSGLVLTYNGELFESYFHSCCGGMSEKAKNVWPTASEEPFHFNRKDRFCEKASPCTWMFKLSRDELAQRFKAEGISPFNRLKDGKAVDDQMPSWTLDVQKRDELGRVEKVLIMATRVSSKPKGKKGKVKTQSRQEVLATIDGNRFRKIVGYTSIKSTLFELSLNNDDFIFSGRGYGHGVGLCQWGSKAMAEEGKNFQDILSFYYPGAALSKHNQSGTKSFLKEAPPPVLNLPVSDTEEPLDEIQTLKAPAQKWKKTTAPRMNGVEFIIRSLDQP